jgi:hypothetical protein
MHEVRRMTNLLRAVLRPRVVRPVLLATASTTLLCAAFAAGSLLSRSDIVVMPRAAVVPPPNVTVEPAPVVMPSTPVVVEAPAPPPPAPRPRLAVPMLDAACVIENAVPRPDSDPRTPTCAWDDGFPAISADGTLIATKYVPPPSMASDNPPSSLSIHFIDTKTSQVVRDSVILAPEESVPFLPKDPQAAAPENASHEDPQQQQQQQQERIMARIARRVAAVQRTLDAQRFRALHVLGSVHTSRSGESTSKRGPDPVYAEIVGTTARIIDTKASQVLWRGDVSPREAKRSEGSDCDMWDPEWIGMWWDPETRNVLAAQTYRMGGCMCSDKDVDTVQQMR